MSKSMASRIAGIGPTWFERRRLGLRNPLGTNDFIHEQIYSSIFPCEFWDRTVNNANASIHGGVFNLEFSPEGSLLVAACEKRSVLVFDPLTYKEIYTIENAHENCVNFVKFLDSRSFATCSDDYTVALWDARNLSQKVRSFKGHTNWVKNIEYSPQDGLLVTSGFDGNILTWEMNKYREGGMVYNKVFGTYGLMRTCLTPDASKMVMCTTGGYLIIIHNLDLNTLTQDMDGFKPNMYRLMQLSQTILPIASDFTHLFKGRGKRNRVEFITDFPKGDDAEVVSSLQVHPNGHSAISRNVNNGEDSEWSCIHNIEERLSSDESDCSDVDDEEHEGYEGMNWHGSSTSISTTPSYIIQHAHVQNGPSRASSERNDNEQRDLSGSPADVWEALVAIQEARVRRGRDRMTLELSARQIFMRQMPDAGILVRPIHSGPDSRVFETRLVPNSGFGERQERGPHPPPQNQNPPEVQRRNVSINTVEVSVPDTDPGRSEGTSRIGNRLRARTRRKVPPRQRYCSLYRRSLVGQYDRTSISRKTIFKPRLMNLKLRRLGSIPKLNTNYEMNETQRLQNEVNKKQSRGADPSGTVNGPEREGPGSSGVRNREGNRFVLRRRMPTSSKNAPGRNARRLPFASTASVQTVDSTVNSIFNTFRVIENNLNSIPETVTTFGGRINSTLQVLRRSLNWRMPANGSNDNLTNSSDNINNNNSNNNNVNNNNNNNNNNDSNENVSGGNRSENAPPVDGLVPGNDTNGENVRGEVRERERTVRDNSDVDQRPTWSGLSWRNSEFARSSGDGEDSSSNNTQSAQSQSNNERTILMGVFRAGSEDGGRGNSMRRHNIAAVTVSSTAQRASDSSIEGLHRVRRSRDCYNGFANNAQQYTLVPVNKKIHQNIKRLTHYIEEPNLGKGFIKELCISPDGRVICSPFGNGIRLLSFSPTVQDISHCYPNASPVPLHELSLNMAHTDTVLCTKFSPIHNLLVSGCLSGKIVYYQPLL